MAVSGDLTLGPHLGQQGQVNGTLTAIGVSPVDADVLWTGSDDGLVQVSTNGGGAWSNLESGGTTADLVVGAGTGVKVGAWANIDPAALADAQLRIMGESANGTADPAWRYIAIEFK